tara:strand:+ start:337 stop:810 length:474 start_codon:yes stop_codon:yes gene_type:complete
MAYSDSQIAEAVSTVHMNSKRQATRNEAANYTGPDIQFIGEKCFAYSGVTSLAGGFETTFLLFDSGPNILEVYPVSFYGARNQGDNLTMTVYFNDIKIYQTELEQSEINFGAVSPTIIPPFTKVKITLHITGGGSIDCGVKLTGDVHMGAERVQGAI